jgi:hypothetical protein
MAGNPQPQGDQYEGFRYTSADTPVDSSPRYDTFRGRMVDTAPYNYRCVTLEQEIMCGGWLPNNTPTTPRGPDPIDLYTLGGRGEPGFDDDPVVGADGHYHHAPPHDGDSQSYD